MEGGVALMVKYERLLCLQVPKTDHKITYMLRSPALALSDERLPLSAIPSLVRKDWKNYDEVEIWVNYCLG